MTALNNQNLIEKNEKSPELSDPFSPEVAKSEPIPETKPLKEVAVETPKTPEVTADVTEQRVKPSLAPVQTPTEPIVPDKSERLITIEQVMQEDLKNTYLRMDPKLQEKFRKKGEEAASKIEVLLQQTKVKVHKIFQLIFDWLKIIPGVNKAFLKQEAKIKTDKIIKIQ